MKIGRTIFTDKERLTSLRRYRILDSEDEKEYDEIVELACQICETPIAVITFLDENRQWFKAQKGLGIKETDIKLAFCFYTVHEQETFIVEDAQADDRFRENTLVTAAPNIRFYAGVPIKINGSHSLGSLAVIDSKPRVLTDAQLLALKILARQIANLLKLRLHNYELNQDAQQKAGQIIDILSRVNDGFLAVDTDWTITFINSKAAEITNRKAENVLGKNLWNEFPEAFGATTFPQKAQDAMALQEEQYLEDYFEPYDRWFETHIYPSSTGVSIYFRDITQRKKAEVALAESESNYRKLIEGNPQPMWIYTLEDFKILEVNESAIRKYGYNREEFLKLTILDLRPKDEVSKLRKFVRDRRVSDGGFFQSGPWKHKLKDGTLVDVEITSHEIIWKGTKARFALAWDVTNRLQMENSLRRAEEQYRSIFENASEGICQTDANGKILAANPALAQMFGYDTPEELMNTVTDMGARLTATAEDRDAIRATLEKEGIAKGLELKMLKKDGQVIWVRSNIRVIRNSQGAVEFVEGTLEDITHKKQAEEKLRTQFEELQKTNQELDRFVYSVSHDLRAPLATILGLIHVSELESPAPVFNEYLKMIKTNIKRLDGFIKDILDYSLNARKELQIEEINFHEMVGEILKNFNFLASADRLKVNLRIKNEIPFYTDPYRISIIVNNLLSNAVKYQDFNKDDSFVSIEIETTEENASIIIADNGIGIAQEHLDKVFNMFYRASENAKGSGLGLYITKETVSKLGGSIQVASTIGKSTSFRIVIPNQRRIA